MASGENRFSTTTMRQTPVLAQSQACSGCGTVYGDPNDISAGVTVTTSSQNGGGGALAFVAPAVGVDVGVGALACPICFIIGGGLFPGSTASNDTTVNSKQAYVFHFTTAAAAASILASGQINTGATSGLAWVTPSPYTSGSLAQAQLSLSVTPDGFFAIPAQNLQTPLSWSIAAPLNNQPGGGVEGTTPLPIPIGGAVWIPFHQ
jgi:hypothetical protein